jgi:pimeloyl-ACP methyl ester carboxylesterase
MVAGKSKDIAFIVLLAGPGIPIDQLMVLQSYLTGKASGMSEEDLAKAEILNKGIYEMVKKSTNTDQLKTGLANYFKQEITKDTSVKMPAGVSEDEFIKSKVDAISTPWLQFFIKYDPVPALEKVKCPVLALNGSKDVQVPPKEDLKGIKEALAKGGNKNVTTIELPNLNHLFQECTTGSPDEYGTIEQTFSPTALTEILKWIKMQIK